MKRFDGNCFEIINTILCDFFFVYNNSIQSKWKKDPLLVINCFNFFSCSKTSRLVKKAIGSQQKKNRKIEILFAKGSISLSSWYNFLDISLGEFFIPYLSLFLVEIYLFLKVECIWVQNNTYTDKFISFVQVD